MAINVRNSVTPGFAALSGYSYGTENRRRRDQDIQIATLAEQERKKMAREQQDEAVRQFDTNFGQQQYEFDTNLAKSNQEFVANIASQVGLTNLASQNRMQEKVFGDKLDLESDRINRDASFANSMKQMQEQDNLYKQRYEQQILFDKQVKEQQKNEIINDITQNPEKYDLLPEEVPDVIAQLHKGISLDKIPTMASLAAEEEKLNRKYPDGRRPGTKWKEGNKTFTLSPSGEVKLLHVDEITRTEPNWDDWKKAAEIVKIQAGVDPSPEFLIQETENLMKKMYPDYDPNPNPDPVVDPGDGEVATPGDTTTNQAVMPGTLPVEDEIKQNKQVAKEGVSAIQTNQRVAEKVQNVVKRSTDTKKPLTRAQKYKISQLVGKIESAKDINERDKYLAEFNKFIGRLEEKYDAADYGKR